MRRFSMAFAVAAVSIALAQPASAQISVGAQGAILTSYDDLTDTSPSEIPDLAGSFGLGARVAFKPPVFPIGLVGQGVYYFPSGDWSYLTYSLAAQFGLPLPMVTPYLIGGWQWRRASFDNASDTKNGAMVGLGVELNLGLALFLEGTMEFNDTDVPDGVTDFDDDPIVIKGGILLG
jgi:hypothetical protein